MTSGVAVEALTLTLGAFRLGKIDFDLPASEILVILGPNGFGKSVTSKPSPASTDRTAAVS